MHVWWARRPLAACRAVLLASMWPDPADPSCPPEFVRVAADEMKRFRDQRGGKPRALSDPMELRQGLLDFIADFANWDNATSNDYLRVARKLVACAHACLSPDGAERPLVIDPFAGGGAIPFEALRVGADAFASDLNPVAVFLNRVLLERMPGGGSDLAASIRRWGSWVKDRAESELRRFHSYRNDGSVPVAYIWARTVISEAPTSDGHSVEVPLLKTMWLSKKPGRKSALRWARDSNGRVKTHSEVVTYADGQALRVRRPLLEVFQPKHDSDVEPGTSRRGSATCPVTGHTTPVATVRAQLSARRGGSTDARLCAVVVTHSQHAGKRYRISDDADAAACRSAAEALVALEGVRVGDVPLIPEESCPPEGALGFRFQKYGIRRWRDIYTPRQLLSLVTFVRVLKSDEFLSAVRREVESEEHALTLRACLALAVGRVNDLSATLCRWLPSLEAVAAANGAQNKMPMMLDFAEANPIGGAGGDWEGQVDWIARVAEHVASSHVAQGTVSQGPAQSRLLPPDLADALVTDPPYYDAFGYSDLSEFFYPWLRRAAPERFFPVKAEHVPKKDEAITIGKTLADGRGAKDDATYVAAMTEALRAAREVVKPGGIGVVVFANKTTKGWEAILQAILDSGWYATASWPIETERQTRQRAIGSAALQSSVHLVCRPRESEGGTPRLDQVGDWRDVLALLPTRIREWMPRLAAEGVVGADAIFACLGPALEIFSVYSRVEKANGDKVSLAEYLEHVWAAVANAALSTIFEDADAAEFDADARLTSMWLWTMGAGRRDSDGSVERQDDEVDGTGDDDEAADSAVVTRGFSLEFDAARMIAQGLGAHLGSLASIVEVKGDTARLLSVRERASALFEHRRSHELPRAGVRQSSQTTLFGEANVAADGGLSLDGRELVDVTTTLDRVHQAMLLFASGRTDTVKRFLVEGGAGLDGGFWRLAQSLSALYPAGTEEKRWIDGLLARRSGLNL